MDANQNHLVQTNTTLKWLATIFTIIGVYTMSISPRLAAESVLLFVLFFFAHIIWAWYGHKVNEKALIWMNLSMLPLDLYAMWIRV